MTRLFYILNAAIVAFSLLEYGSLTMTEDIIAAVLAGIMVAGILLRKFKGENAGTGLSALMPWLGIAFLATRPFCAARFWWENESSAAVMVSLAALGVLAIFTTLKTAPRSRDEATDNFLFSLFVGTVLGALAASSVTTAASGNSTLSSYPVFITIFAAMILAAAWLRFAGRILPKALNIARMATAAALAVAFGAGLLAHHQAEAAFAAGKESAGKNNEEARKNFREVAENNADPLLREKARLELARIALMENNIEEAAKEIELSGDASRPEAAVMRAEIALKMLERASALLSEKKPGEGKALALRAARIAPASAKVFAGCGRFMLDAGNFEEALRWAGEALKMNAAAPEAWEVKLKAHLALGDDESAARTFEKYPSIKLPDDRARIRIGRMLVLLGNAIRAKALMLAFEQSASAEAQYWLARANELLGDWEAAAALYKKAASDRMFADGLYRIGANLESAGKKAEALESYEATLKSLPRHFEAARGKARIAGEKDQYADYSPGTIGTSSVQNAYGKVLPKETAAMEPFKLTFNFIIIETGTGGNFSLTAELKGPLYNTVYTYSTALGNMSLFGLAVGECKIVTKEINIPSLPPGEWKAFLRPTSGEPVELGAIKAEMSKDYSKKIVLGTEMPCGYEVKKKLLYATNKKYFDALTSKMRLLFALSTDKGKSILHLKVSGSMAKAELPKILVVFGRKPIYLGFIKSESEHTIDIPFESTGGLGWFSVEFLNDYYAKTPEGKMEDRNLFVHEASVN
jgi:tetratricopeptide (TPR) repeat protein